MLKKKIIFTNINNRNGNRNRNGQRVNDNDNDEHKEGIGKLSFLIKISHL